MSPQELVPPRGRTKEQPMSPFLESSVVWMNGRLVPWKDATIHLASHVIHYGSCHLRRLPGLRHAQGDGRLPAAGPHPAALQFLQDLPDGRPLHPGRIQPGHHRHRQGQQAQGLLRPAASSIGATGPSASIPSPTPSTAPSSSGSGASTWARRPWRTASMSASRPGGAWPRTPSRPWPRPAPTT